MRAFVCVHARACVRVCVRVCVCGVGRLGFRSVSVYVSVSVSVCVEWSGSFSYVRQINLYGLWLEP